MFTKFNKSTTNFNDLEFVQDLQENGFDIHNIGGESNADFHSGEVFSFKNGQYQLVGQESVVLTCDANTFFKTLADVEKQFKYTLFG